MTYDPRNQVILEAVCLSAQHLQEVAQQGGRGLIFAHCREIDPEFR